MEKYTIERELGEGMFGKAFLCKDEKQRHVVVKRIKKKGSVVDAALLRKEINIMKDLKHPNVVKYLESFEDEGNIYIVIE